VALAAGAPMTGRITETDDDGAVLDVGGAERRLEYAEVKKAKVQIEFKRLDEADFGDEDDPDDLDDGEGEE